MSLIIYTKTGCGWCEEAMQFLSENNVQYEEREVLGNEEYFRELQEKSGQDSTPTVDLDGKILVDTNASAIRIFLKENGILN
jgi:glutaredoxin